MKKKTLLLALLATMMVSNALFAGSVKTGRKDGVLSLENGLSRLELNESNMTLRQITNLENGCNYVAEPGGDLFQLTMLIPGDSQRPQWYVLPKGLPIQADAFGKYTATAIGNDDEGGWKLEYSAPDWKEGELMATVTVRMTKDSPFFIWSISIDNRTDMAIQHLEFPMLSGLGVQGAEETEYLAVPVYSGLKTKDIRNNMQYGLGYTEYPSGGMTIQLMTYEDGHDNGFYYASHDSNNYRKTFKAYSSMSKASFSESLIHYPEQPFAHGIWALEYPVVNGPFIGDWYDGCKLYRRWAITQNRWKKSLKERDDIPSWLYEYPVCFQGNEWEDSEEALLAFADQIANLRKALGYPIVYHWYMWQQYLKHDFRYPDYLPARQGFAEAVRKVHEAGVKVVPYFNIHLCETTLPIWRQLELYNCAKRDPSGNLWRNYGVCDNRGKVDDNSTGPVDVFRGDTDGRDMVPMCTYEPVWQDVMLDLARKVLDDYKVDAIYWDETYSYPGLCYAKNHHHSWIGGRYNADGIWQIHRKTHGLRAEPVSTWGENLGEAYIDACQAQLNAHSDGKADSLPLFQTVYADRTTEIGLFVKQKEFISLDVFASKLAFNLLRGRILGWFNSDQRLQTALLQSEYAEQLKLLKHYCDVRLAGLPWLFWGEMLRKPDMSKLPAVTKTWSPWASSTDMNYVFSTVEGAAYRAPDGRIGLVLTNMTDKEQVVSFPWNYKDWGGKPEQKVICSQYRDSKWSEPAEMPLDGTVKAELRPYEALIISFQMK